MTQEVNKDQQNDVQIYIDRDTSICFESDLTIEPTVLTNIFCVYLRFQEKGTSLMEYKCGQ